MNECLKQFLGSTNPASRPTFRIWSTANLRTPHLHDRRTDSATQSHSVTEEQTVSWSVSFRRGDVQQRAVQSPRPSSSVRGSRFRLTRRVREHEWRRYSPGWPNIFQQPAIRSLENHADLLGWFAGRIGLLSFSQRVARQEALLLAHRQRVTIRFWQCYGSRGADAAGPAKRTAPAKRVSQGIARPIPPSNGNIFMYEAETSTPKRFFRSKE